MPASKSGIWKNPRHGTSTGYANYHCRCDECRAWNAAQARKRRAEKPERYRKYMRAWYRRNPKAERDKVLRKYKLSREGYEKLLTKQGGVCAICGKPPSTKRLAIDHDHNCCGGQKSCGGCIRGLLCSSCNSGISFFGDDIAQLESAISYLREYSNVQD